MIKANASANEKLSPFYKANEAFCIDFENFIKQNQGICKGNYNAWSYLISGKISEPNQWVLEYKKSTFSSGNLLLPIKSQNLFISAIWKTKGSHSDFKIRKKHSLDSISSIVNQDISTLNMFKKYVIVAKNKPKSILKLVNLLKPLFVSEEIYEITNFKNELKIELRTEKHYFDIFKQLMDFKIEH